MNMNMNLFIKISIIYCYGTSYLILITIVFSVIMTVVASNIYLAFTVCQALLLILFTYNSFNSHNTSRPTLATPQTVACQAPLSMVFPRQESWSGLPFPSPGDLLDPEIEARSPALQADSLLTELQGYKGSPIHP